jgi:hypothetical protein
LHMPRPYTRMAPSSARDESSDPTSRIVCTNIPQDRDVRDNTTWRTLSYYTCTRGSEVIGFDYILLLSTTLWIPPPAKLHTPQDSV